MSVDVKFEGVDQFIKKLERFPDIAEASLQQTAVFHKREIQRRISSTKTDENGNRWAPWSMATQRMRARTGGSLLNFTGQLYGSINYKVDGLDVTFGSSVPYAVYLQEGTRNMPARPFLNVGPATVEFLQKNFSVRLRNDF